MKQQLEEIRAKAAEALQQARALQELDAARVKFIGKKGELTAILKGMGKLTAEERPVIGQLANDIRADIEAHIQENVEQIKERMLEEKLKRLQALIDEKQRHSRSATSIRCRSCLTK